MSQPAPAVTRAAQVIHFLASHPTESFGLSELSQRLDVNLASTHRILAALTNAGLIERHPRHRTYSLGLALVAAGQAALERHPTVEIAQRELQHLAEELGVECLAIAVAGDEFLVIARSGRPQPGRPTARVGERLPNLPFLGPLHWAWAPEEEFTSWLSHGDMSPAQLEFFRQAVTTVRSRGYSVACVGKALERLQEPLLRMAETPHDSALRSQVRQLIGELSQDELQLLQVEPGQRYRVSHIAAAVFDPKGRIALEISLVGIRRRLSAADISDWSHRVRASALQVTREIKGRPPQSA